MERNAYYESVQEAWIAKEVKNQAYRTCKNNKAMGRYRQRLRQGKAKKR